MLALKTATPDDWADFALQDFDAFLRDHASCERKATAMGLSFVTRYPERSQLVEKMIQFSREELEHFHQVYRLIAQRGLQLHGDEEDEYVNLMLKHVRSGRDERFLDRLLISGLIESRGAERIALIAEKLTDPKLNHFYRRLARAEEHHRDLFVEMALLYFPTEVVEARAAELVEIEAKAIASVPYRHAVH